MPVVTQKVLSATDVLFYKQVVQQFLASRNFTQDTDEETSITGVNRDYEFHMVLTDAGIDITCINRYDYEVHQEHIAYDEDIATNLFNMVGR